MPTLCFCCAQVVLFGKGSAAGFSFGTTSMALGNTVGKQYTAISGPLGSTEVAAISLKSGGSGGSKKRAVETISFLADAVADDVSKGSELPSGYGGSVIVVP